MSSAWLKQHVNARSVRGAAHREPCSYRNFGQRVHSRFQAPAALRQTAPTCPVCYRRTLALWSTGSQIPASLSTVGSRPIGSLQSSMDRTVWATSGIGCTARPHSSPWTFPLPVAGRSVPGLEDPVQHQRCIAALQLRDRQTCRETQKVSAPAMSLPHSAAASATTLCQRGCHTTVPLLAALLLPMLPQMMMDRRVAVVGQHVP
mmetsp:Transcript_126698/g.253209  ORF Transcript_126698/g.253209 Transcript_126698/m.253209 type:complete len:204 (+) Transcript_126698:350-961(+)